MLMNYNKLSIKKSKCRLVLGVLTAVVVVIDLRLFLFGFTS